MELIRKIYPASSKGHNFTKWVEAVPLKKVEQKDVIQFIKEYIIHRFGIPQSITTDQGTMFIRYEMTYFARAMAFNSSDLLPFMPKKMDMEKVLIWC